MKPRTIAILLVLFAAAAGFVVWRRRGAAAGRPELELGLADGSSCPVPAGDPAAAELETLAADVRAAFGEVA